ncbi:uncharacterized protein LOC112576002 [Pomacea canaliculata]|uniref:uncharacterized protein LOC112576002 n=1 Tax=Pomacea canaliculata TaxID=400727 RepID=UPI000D739C30|nr:uncharacterized protein LOC112576002 [Pomacea canaliculata]
MSGHQSTAQQKAGRRTKCRARGGASQRGGNPVEVYLHFVKDMQAALLAGSGSASPIQDIQHKSGADVQLAPNPSPVQDTKTVIIRGSRLQIETAVRLINQETGVKVLWPCDYSECTLYISSPHVYQDPG